MKCENNVYRYTPCIDFYKPNSGFFIISKEKMLRYKIACHINDKYLIFMEDTVFHIVLLPSIASSAFSNEISTITEK